MSGDACKTKKVEVTIQENGIIRGPDGDIIARLLERVCFEDLDASSGKVKDDKP